MRLRLCWTHGWRYMCDQREGGRTQWPLPVPWHPCRDGLIPRRQYGGDCNYLRLRCVLQCSRTVSCSQRRQCMTRIRSFHSGPWDTLSIERAEMTLIPESQTRNGTGISKSIVTLEKGSLLRNIINWILCFSILLHLILVYREAAEIA